MDAVCVCVCVALISRLVWRVVIVCDVITWPAKSLTRVLLMFRLNGHCDHVTPWRHSTTSLLMFVAESWFSYLLSDGRERGNKDMYDCWSWRALANDTRYNAIYIYIYICGPDEERWAYKYWLMKMKAVCVALTVLVTSVSRVGALCANGGR